MPLPFKVFSNTVLATAAFLSCSLTAQSSECPKDLTETLKLLGKVGSSKAVPLVGFQILSSRQKSDLDFALDLVGVRMDWSKGEMKLRKQGAPINELEDKVASHISATSFLEPKEKITENLNKLLDDIFAIYNDRFDSTFTTKRFQLGETSLSPKSMNEIIQKELYRDAKNIDQDDWQMVGDLTDVRNPLMKGLKREIWWDRYKGDDPIGDLRISRQTRKIEGKDVLESVEIIRTFPDGTPVPFVYRVNAGKLQPLKLNHENFAEVRRCLGCHSGPTGHFAKVIKLKGYSPSPDWRIDNDNKLFPHFKPYAHGLK